MALVAVLPECSQRVVIADRALDHMARYRQLSRYSKEAGGQLFGTVSSSEVVVFTATGPYRGDQRWRTSYRSNPKAAQRTIDEQAREGHLYLGEWHTHPENHPNASGTDFDAMARLQQASSTRMANILMVIQGRVLGERGLALHSFGVDGPTRWQVHSIIHGKKYADCGSSQ
jgi:integrative and conjugative element protein (TIGR02256 family)